MQSDFVKNVLGAVDLQEQQRVQAMFANYQITDERFEDAFDLIKYRISSENQGFNNAQFAVQAMMVIGGLEHYFEEEEKKKGKNPQAKKT